MKLFTQALKFAAAAVGLICISGCTHIKRGTLAALRDIDFQTVNPGTARLAIALPNGAKLQSVTLELQYIHEGTRLFDEEIELEIVVAGPELNRVGFPSTAHNRVLLRVPQANIDDIAAFQAQLLHVQNSDIDAQASVGIGNRLDPGWVKQYCAKGNQKFEISAWVMLDVRQGYLPLFKESPLGRLLGSQAGKICQRQPRTSALETHRRDRRQNRGRRVSSEQRHGR